MREWRVPIHDGSLYVRAVGGADAGETLILIHGGPGISHEYLLPLEELAGPDLRVVTFDHRGVGHSTGAPVDGDAMSTLAADVEAIRTSLAVERLHLLGHSCGGLTVVAYGTQHAEHLASAIFVDTESATAVGLANAGERFNARLATLRAEGLVADPPAGEDDDMAWLRAMFPVYLADPRRSGLVPLLGATSFNEAAHKAVRKGFGTHEFSMLIPRIGCPTLSFIAEVPFGVEMASEIADLLPAATSRRIVMRECGHVPWFECREWFLGEVRSFLAPVVGPAPA